MEAGRRESLLLGAARRLVERCPRLVRHCYWAGTSVISLEELGHRSSFDLDLHTRTALQDVRPFLAEMQAGFPGEFELVQAPDDMGSAFGGVLAVGEAERLTGWTDSSLEEDLRGYPEADPAGAREARDLLLRWIREDAGRPEEEL